MEATGCHAGRQEVGSEPQGMYITYLSLPSMNKAAHSGFEIQRIHHQKSKTGVSVTPQKGFMSSNNLQKK